MEKIRGRGGKGPALQGKGGKLNITQFSLSKVQAGPKFQSQTSGLGGLGKLKIMDKR